MLKVSAADWKGQEKPKKITKSVSNSSKLNFEQHLFQRAWASNIHLASNAVEVYARVNTRGTARGSSPTAVQAWQPCPRVMSAYCMFDLSVYYLFLQYFDTIGWVL